MESVHPLDRLAVRFVRYEVVDDVDSSHDHHSVVGLDLTPHVGGQ